MTVPAGAIDPVTIADNGGLTMLMQGAEFLCVLQPDLTLKPRAGDELVAQRRRLGLDLQAAPGGEIPERRR